MWFSVSEVTTGSHDGNGKRSARRIEGLKVRKVYWSRGQLLARIVWTPRPSTKEGTSLRYTVALWSGQCQDSDDTSLQPRSQLAATTEVCFVAIMTLGTFLFSYSVGISAGNNFYFKISLTSAVLCKEFKCFMLHACKKI
jgi:hypothetical protein